MTKFLILSIFLFVFSQEAKSQTKKDGTPDMRYKVNKEIYGSGFSTPNYSTPSYSTPSYLIPDVSSPSLGDYKQERNYENGGQLKIQNGYFKNDGTYVSPHLKTSPDNVKWNNLESWDPK